MSVDLLDKTRKINGLLRDNRVSKVAFTDLCQVLGDLLNSKVFVISSKGKILGMSPGAEVGILSGFPSVKGKLIDAKLSKRFLEVLSTKENVNLETLGIPREETGELQALITPVYIAGKRLGTLFLYRRLQEYGIEDIILTEYSTTVVGLEMLRSVNEESAEESRKEHIVQSAISTLSYSELEAIIHIFEELNGTEGILIASKIADRVGITRSVIVNALRKFESAGVIESRSSGMKGTYIKVVNDYVFTELEHIKAERGRD